MPALLQEIKDRKMTKTVAIYLGSAWVCLEALNFFIEKYGWVGWLFQASLYLALCGVPFAIIYTWFHGLPGNQKIQRKEILLYSLNTVLAVFLVGKAVQGGDIMDHRTKEISGHSIAVLPFRNLNNDPKEDFMADGITEDIISRISQIADFKVISRTSSFHYKNTTKTLPEIGTELMVANVLEGSIQHAGDMVRISVKLVNAMSDENLWVEVFDRRVTEIFKVQSEVADRIASSLKLKLSPDEKERLSDAPDFNLSAYTFYQQGLAYLRKGESEENFKNALLCFQRSIAADSTFYLSYAGISETYIDYVYWGRASGAMVVDSARKAAQHALELNNHSGHVYAILAAIALNFDLDSHAFEKYCRRAIALEPNNALLYDYLSQYYCSIGKTDESIKNIDKAIEFDPKLVHYRTYKGHVYYFGRQFDKAEAALKESDPNDNYTLFVRGSMYAAQKKYDLAIREFQKRTVGTTTNFILGLTYGLAGKKDEAERIYRFQMEKAKVQYVPPIVLGYVNFSIGRNKEAIDQFENHFKNGIEGMSWLQFIRYDPLLDPLRQNPRFQKLLAGIKF